MHAYTTSSGPKGGLVFQHFFSFLARKVELCIKTEILQATEGIVVRMQPCDVFNILLYHYKEPA